MREENQTAISHFLGDELEFVGKDAIGKAFAEARPVPDGQTPPMKDEAKSDMGVSLAEFEGLKEEPQDRDIESSAVGGVATIEVTENGIANELVQKFGRSIKYDHNRRKWYIWKNGVWKLDETAHVRNLLREITCDATEGWHSQELQKIRRASFVSGAERLALSDQLVSVTANYWDRDTMLLGCPNATVNLRTGAMKDPESDDGITKLCGSTPKEGECPNWQRFLSEVCGNDEEVVAFLQIWVGYLLTGRTEEQSLLFKACFRQSEPNVWSFQTASAQSCSLDVLTKC